MVFTSRLAPIFSSHATPICVTELRLASLKAKEISRHAAATSGGRRWRLARCFDDEFEGRGRQCTTSVAMLLRPQCRAVASCRPRLEIVTKWSMPPMAFSHGRPLPEVFSSPAIGDRYAPMPQLRDVEALFQALSKALPASGRAAIAERAHEPLDYHARRAVGHEQGRRFSITP